MGSTGWQLLRSVRKQWWRWTVREAVGVKDRRNNTNRLIILVFLAAWMFFTILPSVQQYHCQCLVLSLGQCKGLSTETQVKSNKAFAPLHCLGTRQRFELDLGSGLARCNCHNGHRPRVALPISLLQQLAIANKAQLRRATSTTPLAAAPEVSA